MPSEIIFHCGDNSDPIPTEELYRALVDAMETPCRLEVHEAGGRMVLSDVGIVLSLIFDEVDNPVTVLAVVSPDVDLHHVAQLCLVFQKLGWDF